MMLKLDALVRREGKAHLEGHERRIVRQKAFAPGQQAHVIQQSCGGDRKMGTMGEKQTKQNKNQEPASQFESTTQEPDRTRHARGHEQCGSDIGKVTGHVGPQAFAATHNEGSVSAVQLLACSA